MQQASTACHGDSVGIDIADQFRWSFFDNLFDCGDDLFGFLHDAVIEHRAADFDAAWKSGGQITSFYCSRNIFIRFKEHAADVLLDLISHLFSNQHTVASTDIFDNSIVDGIAGNLDGFFIDNTV